MDGYEATRIVFSRIQNLDPENASKIMGLLLIQDHGEKEMIRLAFGPEALLHSVILKARKELGLPLNLNSTPTSPSPFLSSNPLPISRQNSRLINSGMNLPSPLTIPNPSSSPTPTTSASWATLSELQNSGDDFVVGADEFQLQEQLSFLNDGSPPPSMVQNNSDLLYSQSHAEFSSSPTSASGDPCLFPSYGWGGSLHRRSCSVNDACLGSEDPNSGLGWKPCLYFARGFCKNGTTCRFLHGDSISESVSSMVGSPSKIEMMENCHELLRSKSFQQQRLASAASQLMQSSSFPYSPKCMNFLLQQQLQQNDTQRAAAAAAVMMNEDLQKFGRLNGGGGGGGMVNPASRQIYLTFPADSTFREEDVSNYFSIYGPVQDVRIPYQQKRMFGFVTFVFPETVKLILSKGNPHFVCDARVLVKPYKEKGKVPDKKQQQQQQQVDGGEFSPCVTPTTTSTTTRDPFDVQVGGRMYYNTQDMLWRRKLEEQADLQQAIELQSIRFMGLQLLDFKKQHHRALSSGSPIPSPTNSPNVFNHKLLLSSFHTTSDSQEENGSGSAPASAVRNNSVGKQVSVNGENGNGNSRGSSSDEDRDLQECLEHNLPDSPFASPTKEAIGDYMAAFSNAPNELIDSDASLASSANSKFSNTTLLPAASALDVAASIKSFNCQIPRFSSEHGSIGMFAGTGGPIGI